MKPYQEPKARARTIIVKSNPRKPENFMTGLQGIQSEHITPMTLLLVGFTILTILEQQILMRLSFDTSKEFASRLILLML